jgi:prepilin-type N-terminal cleavage/methylation domain-containing protein
LGPFNSHSPIHNQAGFTLVEVMISILLLSFISFSTYKMVDSNTDTRDRVVKEDQQTVQSLTATGRLDSDISQLYSPLYSYSKLAPTATNAADPYADTNASGGSGWFDGKAKNGELIPQFKSEDKSSLIFLTTANRRKISDSKESRFAWVKYSLRAMEADPDKPDDKVSGLYGLVRQTIPTNVYSSSLDWDTPKFQLVMDRIKSLEFSFWDERAKKFTTSLSELNENKYIVRSLKVDIVWVDDEQHEQKISKTFRILNPYFNPKQDGINTGATTGGFSGSVPGTPDPTNPNGNGGTNVVQ